MSFEYGTLGYQIEGHVRLFIFKNLSSVSTDFHGVKYFFHPTCLFIYYTKRQGFATLPVYYILLPYPTLIFDTPEYIRITKFNFKKCTIGIFFSRQNIDLFLDIFVQKKNTPQKSIFLTASFGPRF